MPDDASTRAERLARIEARAVALRRARRTRRQIAGVAVIVALAAGGTLTWSAIGRSSGHRVTVVNQPPPASSTATTQPAVTTTSTTPASTTSSTQAGHATIPATYLAEDSSEGPAALVVVETTSGKILRTLVPSIPGGGVGGISVTADRHTVFYGQGLGTCGAELDAVAAAGGSSRVVAHGAGMPISHPAVRPDGALVAFGRYDCQGHIHLAISHADGSGETIAATDEEPASDQAWSPDGQVLLTREATPTPRLHAVRVAATGAATSDQVIPAGDNCYFASAQFESANTIVADRFCGPATDIVRMSFPGGQITDVLVPARPGRATLLGSLDANSGAVLWADAPPQTGLDPGTMTWYVLSAGSSTILPRSPNLTPAAWLD